MKKKFDRIVAFVLFITVFILQFLLSIPYLIYKSFSSFEMKSIISHSKLSLELWLSYRFSSQYHHSYEGMDDRVRCLLRGDTFYITEELSPSLLPYRSVWPLSYVNLLHVQVPFWKKNYLRMLQEIDFPRLFFEEIIYRKRGDEKTVVVSYHLFKSKA